MSMVGESKDREDRVEDYGYATKAKSFNSRDPEKYEDGNGSESSENLKLDNNCLPLVPQPSRFKDDPLVCPRIFYQIKLLSQP